MFEQIAHPVFEQKLMPVTVWHRARCRNAGIFAGSLAQYRRPKNGFSLPFSEINKKTQLTQRERATAVHV